MVNKSYLLRESYKEKSRQGIISWEEVSLSLHPCASYAIRQSKPSTTCLWNVGWHIWYGRRYPSGWEHKRGITMISSNTWLSFLNNNLMQKNRLWKDIWIAILWSIWNQRNWVVFKGRRMDPGEILSLEQLLAWSWMKRKITSFNFAFSNWVLYPLNCLCSIG